MNCQTCGKEIYLPFQCPYCGNQFCNDHRLPENHICQNMDAARTTRNDDSKMTVGASSYKYTVSFGQPRVAKGHVYFSPKELKHLATAALLVIGVGFSAGLYIDYSKTSLTLALAASATILATSFFVHEIAHKVTAQKRGLWAEFRLTTWGAVITLIFMILPTPFKLISPGAVMISGSTSTEEIGKISIAGPTTNIVLSIMLLGASFIPSSYSSILLLGALLNGYIALFNMIPIGILDGLKIFNWNKKIWALAFGASIVLTAAAYLMIQPIIYAT
jgi:Zn-dependent protease